MRRSCPAIFHTERGRRPGAIPGRHWPDSLSPEKPPDSESKNLMKMPFKPTLVSLVLLAALIFATGCRNTAHGFGKDVENAGEKIQDKTD